MRSTGLGILGRHGLSVLIEGPCFLSGLVFFRETQSPEEAIDSKTLHVRTSAGTGKILSRRHKATEFFIKIIRENLLLLLYPKYSCINDL